MMNPVKPAVPRAPGWSARRSLLATVAFLLIAWQPLPGHGQTGTIQFKSASFTFSEGIGIALVGLERTSSTGGAQVTFQSVALTATAGVDFQPFAQTYTFQVGETNLSLIVQLFDNAQFQLDRQFKLTMSNPVGLTIGSPAETTVTIADNDEITTAGRGAAGTNLLQGVYALATNSTGALLAAGHFRTFNGQVRNHLVRLLPDGGLDAGFDTGAGPDARVWALAVQSDDRILVAGDFLNVNGSSRRGIARLLSTGGLDASFNPGAGVNNVVESVEVLPDNRVLIGGFFSLVNNQSRTDVAILNENGSLDLSFNAVTPPTFAGHVARRQGAHIIVGGEITLGAGANVTNALMRFDATGTRDTSFQVAVGDIFLNRITGLLIEADDKIVISGTFRGINGQPTGSATVARLEANGTLDSSFNVGTGANDWVLRIARQADGKYLIAGFFTSFNGVPRAGIARLNSNGSLDTSFDPGGGANDAVYVALPVAGNSVQAAGSFSRFDGYDRFCLAELLPTGALKTAPVQLLAPLLETGANLRLQLVVEPGRDFRLLASPSLTGWSPVSTNRTARRSFELTRPATANQDFFQVEQAFDTQ